MELVSLRCNRDFTDSADMNTRLQLSDTSSIPPMHGGFLLVSFERESQRVQVNAKYIYRNSHPVIIDLPVSQWIPVKPAVQEQLYPFTASVQLAPFWHGTLRHSSISAKLRRYIRTCNTIHISAPCEGKPRRVTSECPYIKTINDAELRFLVLLIWTSSQINCRVANDLKCHVSSLYGLETKT